MKWTWERFYVALLLGGMLGTGLVNYDFSSNPADQDIDPEFDEGLNDKACLTLKECLLIFGPQETSAAGNNYREPSHPGSPQTLLDELFREETVADTMYKFLDSLELIDEESSNLNRFNLPLLGSPQELLTEEDFDE